MHHEFYQFYKLIFSVQGISVPSSYLIAPIRLYHSASIHNTFISALSCPCRFWLPEHNLLFFLIWNRIILHYTDSSSSYSFLISNLFLFCHVDKAADFDNLVENVFHTLHFYRNSLSILSDINHRYRFPGYRYPQNTGNPLP